MRIEFYKTYNQLHTWTGIIAGLFLFICFVTGALTMFKKPLNQWALQPESSLNGIAYDQYDELIQQVLHTYPKSQENLSVHLPLAQPQSAPVTWMVEDHETHAVEMWHASFSEDGQLVAERSSVSAIGDFMDHLHRTAGIPGGQGHDAIGTYVMGIVAALYFLAIVSGLIIFLPTWIKDFLSMRKGKNRKRFWIDFHNVLGITALPFHIVIAITTVAFAYHDIFYGSLQALVYKDTPMFTRPAPAPADRNFTHLASVDQLTEAVQTLEPDFQTATLNFRNLNSPRATVLVGGEMEGHWIRGPYYAYVVSDPYTAESGYTAMLPNQPGATPKIVNGFFALHFGGFGGDTIRWIYFGLGISGALLFLSGNILWIETRRRRQKKPEQAVEQKKSTLVMARLTVGVAMGALIGIALSFLCAKWLPHKHYDIALWQQLAYYSGFVVAVAWAFLQRPLTAAKHQLIALCVLCIFLFLSSFKDAFVNNLQAIDLTFAFMLALVTAGLFATLSWLRKREALIEHDSIWT